MQLPPSQSEADWFFDLVCSRVWAAQDHGRDIRGSLHCGETEGAFLANPWWQGSARDWSRQMHLDNQKWTKDHQLLGTGGAGSKPSASARHSEVLQPSKLRAGKPLSPSSSGQLIRPLLQASRDSRPTAAGPAGGWLSLPHPCAFSLLH